MDYVIIDRKPARGNAEIILCELPKNEATPWATWLYYRDGTTGRMVRSDGQYYYPEEGEAGARKHFDRRK